jgi:effector-binding domain-containing protein
MKVVLLAWGLAAFVVGAASGQNCSSCVRPAAERTCGSEEPVAAAERQLAEQAVDVWMLPEWTVAFLAGSGGYVSEERALLRIVRWLAAERLPMVGKPFVSFQSRTPDSLGSTGFFVAVPVPSGVTAAESTGIAVRTWGGFRVASAVHVGPRDGLKAALERLEAWVEANEWKAAGGVVAFYHDLPGTASSDSLQIEVAIPVRKAGNR